MKAAALLLASALFILGCAPTTAYVAARQIEKGAAGFVDVAADTWHAYSHAQLENYKNGCGDLECFKTTAGQWESGTVAPADKAIAAGRDAVKAFGDVLDASGSLQAKDFSTAIQKLIAAVSSMVSILNGYGLSLTMLKFVLLTTTVVVL